MQKNESSSAWTEFALKIAGEAVTKVSRTSQQSGAEVIETRSGEAGTLRHWDTETLKIDKEIEDYYVEQLAEHGIDAIMLSEEAGRKVIDPRTAAPLELDRPIFFVSDPFDGSLLYKRNIPAFWYTALAIYTRPDNIEVAEPLTAVVTDLSSRVVQYCDSTTAYEGVLDGFGKVGERREIKPNDTTKLEDAFLETYMMKPPFLYPTAEIFKFLFSRLKFILPNGGPCGFCDVANGRIDIYFGHKQPHNDVYPGLAVAEKAGCVISTFEGHPVQFDDNVERRYNVLCTCTPQLHEKVLKLLAENNIKDTVGQEDD